MKATGRDRLITIERATVTQDDPGSGENVETWGTLAQVYAGKHDVSDRERLAASEMQAELTTRFRILFSHTVADVNPKDRVIFEGRTYNIVAVREIGRREGLEISASARAD